MARLQLQPQQELIDTVAQHLMAQQSQHQQQQQWQQQQRQRQQMGAAMRYGRPSDPPSSRDEEAESHEQQLFMAAAWRTHLAGCSARSFGALCYSLNFFLLRDPSFWATAAAVALQQLDELKPANLSNVLQGLALSGWVLDPEALGPQQVSSSRLGVEAQQQQQQQQQQELSSASTAGAAGNGDDGVASAAIGSSSSSSSTGGAATVLSLLRTLEASIINQPSQLRLWRLRDISQLVQAYALIGFRCGPLFAVIAQYLLEYAEPAHEQMTAQAAVQQQQVTHHHQQQQQVRPAWSAPSSSVLAAAYPSSSSSSSGPGWSGGEAPSGSVWGSTSWHDKGRGPARLAECRVGDAVGIAWAYVHSFCPNQLLLYELAAVLTHKASQLHAADVSRVLWAYATAEVRLAVWVVARMQLGGEG
jgi:hypothetical protein